jgi:hypothetical protein
MKVRHNGQIYDRRVTLPPAVKARFRMLAQCSHAGRRR